MPGKFSSDRPVFPDTYEEITVTGVATLLTAANITQRIIGAIIQVKSSALRYRLDGTAPAGTVGHDMFTGDILILNRVEAQNIQMLRQGATNAVIGVTYYAQN